MNVIREIIATFLFIIAVVLTIYICTNTFGWAYLFVAILCYFAAYLIWPSKRGGQRDDSYIWLDILEFFIEIPFRVIMWLIRLLKHSDGPGIDL